MLPETCILTHAHTALRAKSHTSHTHTQTYLHTGLLLIAHAIYHAHQLHTHSIMRINCTHYHAHQLHTQSINTICTHTLSCASIAHTLYHAHQLHTHSIMRINCTRNLSLLIAHTLYHAHQWHTHSIMRINCTRILSCALIAHTIYHAHRLHRRRALPLCLLLQLRPSPKRTPRPLLLPLHHPRLQVSAHACLCMLRLCLN